MGRTHTSRPDLPSASANPQVLEHATPLEAEVGSEFLEKLASRGQKNKAPAPETGSSRAPPAKRSRKEVVGGKEVTTKHYRKQQMPVASGLVLKITKSASGMRPESSEDVPRASPPPQPNHRAEEDLVSPPETQDTGASNIGAGSKDAGRAEPQVPPVPKKKKKTASASSPSKTVPDSSAPASSAPAKEAPEAPAPNKAPTPPPAAYTGEPAPAKPTLPKGTSSPSSLVLHTSRAAIVAGETASAQLGRITELTRSGADLGYLLDYAEKWNQADVSPATCGLGKDKLPVVDPTGPRSTVQHFGRLRRAVKEFDTAWHDANNNVLSTLDARKHLFEELLWEHRELSAAHTIPEATVEALTTQIATLQGEKEQLAKEHQQALDAQTTLATELKRKLMEAELRHSRELKEAEAKLDESLKEFTNSSAVLRTELEEQTKAR
nr:uncharacterized protein LOC127339991 [Lolium perenne]